MNTPITTPGPAQFRKQQAMNENYIVVEDPEGEYWEGSVIPAARAKMLEARGVIAIPFEPALSHVGNGGYAKRSWGAGYPLDFRVPRMCAPLTMYCNKSFIHLTWRARIMPEDHLIEAIKRGDKLEGMLRFASDTGSSSYAATLSSKEVPILIKQLGKLDDRDGWIVGGSAQINISQEGQYGFALYGMASGVRAIWVAASTAANP